MNTYEYNCNKLEQLRDVFDQINNKNNIAYNNKYYDLPFNNEVIDIVYFGSVFNSNKYTKISEFDILDARIKLGVDYKKYSLIPLFKSNKSEYIFYNYNVSKYQLYLVKVNEDNYNQLSNDNNVIIEDLGVVYLKNLEEDFDVCQIIDKEILLAKHNEYQDKSKAVYNAILNNAYLNKILKTSFYIDLPKNKNAERCERVGNEVAKILNELVPIKQGQNNDVELIIRQKMLFGMLDIAKIRNDVFTTYIKFLKDKKSTTISNEESKYSTLSRLYNLKSLSKSIKEALELNCDNLNHLRKLDIDEILNASKELQVNFVEIGLIPLFDIFDNDFICFDINNNEWCVFNIVDEIKFKKSSQLEELLNFKK